MATDHVRAERWAELLALEPALRGDAQYWTGLWGPACAVGAWHERRDDARDLLEECIQGGFHQLENLGPIFGQSFGTEPGWPELQARIRANVPPPPVELLQWPSAGPVLPLGLFRLDQAGEARLAARLPRPRPGSWATAEMMLDWVTNRWRHSGTNHDQSLDANVILDRAERGDRFACREYTVLLTQALNAVRIPARRLTLLKAAYHAGIGTGHMVTEAWIDELGQWVVLDGQNGAVWRDAAGRPLGVLELQQRYRAGDRPGFTGSGRNFSPDEAGDWFAHFHTAAVIGQLAWSAGPFVPVAEDGVVIRCERLTAGDAGCSPDLAAISTGVADQDGPALAFHCDHPYAAGFRVTGPDGEVASLGPGQLLPLDTPGEHRLTVSVETPYGRLAPQPLRYIRH